MLICHMTALHPKHPKKVASECIHSGFNFSIRYYLSFSSSSSCWDDALHQGSIISNQIGMKFIVLQINTHRSRIFDLTHTFKMAIIMSFHTEECCHLVSAYEASHQSVLNAAARLVTRRRKFDSILDSMRYDLHWLPVHQRIHFKTCVLVNKCRNYTAPSYLTEMCVPVSTVSSHRHLRSAAHYDMTVPRT